MIDIEALQDFLTCVVSHYERTAPTVSAWADALYRTLNEDTGKVTLRELLAAQTLFDVGRWEDPHLAANRIYKLQHACQQETTGHAGF